MTSNTKNKHKEEKTAWILIALSCLIYFSSYVMRYSYTVSMAKIIEVTSLTESQAGIVGTALFFSYGIGQIISGFLGDKLKPGAIVFAGAVVGSLCNFVFPFCGSVGLYVAVWAVNGFAQAMLWPPLVRIFSDRLSPEKCTTAIVLVTIAANLASVMLYLVIPQIIKALSWQSVFLVCGSFSAAAAAVWAVGYGMIARKKTENNVSCPDVSNTEYNENSSDKVKLFPVLVSSGVIFVLIGIISQGFLRDGITTWFPSYVSQTFSLPAENSIFITAALSVTAIVGVYLTKWLYRRFFRNEVKISIVFFAVTALLSLILFAFYSSGIALSVICSALSVALAHGINLMLIAYIPTHFARFNITSTVSGVTNACTYIGSALSSYLFALVAEFMGWRFVILCWAVIAAVGCLFCVLAYRPWNRFLAKPCSEGGDKDLVSSVSGADGSEEKLAGPNAEKLSEIKENNAADIKEDYSQESGEEKTNHWTEQSELFEKSFENAAVNSPVEFCDGEEKKQS